MPDCPFCEIVAGKAEAVVVYSDGTVVAFMDKNPINPGHVLVVPRDHVEHVQDLDERSYLDLMRAARHIAQAANKAYSPRKMGFAVAGFDVPHAHLHIVPLHDYHDLTSARYLNSGKLHHAGEAGPEKPTRDQLEAEASKIQAGLGDQ